MCLCDPILFFSGSSFQYRVWSTCENDDICRKALAAHAEGSKAEHSFRDITHRVDKDTLNNLKLAQECHRSNLQSELASLGPRWGQKHRQNRRSLITKHSWLFFDEAVTILKGPDVEFQISDECTYKQSKCFVYPTRPYATGHIHLEIGGNTCVPWSTANRDAMGWLDPLSLACLIWFASLTQVKPHAILCECVPGFPVRAFDAFFEGFTCKSVVLDAVAFGLPIQRPRRWTFLINKEYGQPMVDLTAKTIARLVGREVAADGTMFLQATPDMVKRHMDCMAADNKQLPPRVDGKSFSCMSVMTTSDRLRFQSVLDDAEERGKPQQLFWDVSQSKDRPRCSMKYVPCLMKKSLIFCTQEKRVLLPVEQLCCQCVPILLPVGSRFASFAPFEMDYLMKMSQREVRQIAGNAMVMPVAGTMIMLLLMLTDWNSNVFP